MKIIQAIDTKWLAGLNSELLGFTHHTLIVKLTDLCSNGTTLHDVDIQELISTTDRAWNPTKNPATKFEQDDRIKQQLEKVGIPIDPQHRLALFKASIKCTGTFDPAIGEWETKPSDQTFANFHPFIVKEFSNATTCKITAQANSFGITNNVEATGPITKKPLGNSSML